MPPASDAVRPAILVSYAYSKGWLTNRTRLAYRDWVMDSGAYTAWTKGITIPLAEYIAICLRLLREDRTLTEVFALDVIGDWRGTSRNTRAMWAAGVPAIPTFHPEEPDDVLRYVVAKGSIAVDGISLTVAEVRKKSFLCWIIPHTREVTALRERTVSDSVNLEADLIAKYVEKLVAPRK